MLISIIVPTLNAAKSLPVMLRQLSERTDVELLVVDGGSTDGTIEIAQSFTPYVFLSQPGQARQLNTGARHATGDILLFLPADTFLLPLALDDFQRRIVGTGAVGGAFDLNIDSGHWLYRWTARLSNRYARFFRSPDDAQGLFVWRQVFNTLGGFPNLPIFSDVAFVRKLRRAGRLAFLRGGLVTSTRRWATHGLVKTTLVNWILRLLYRLWISPRVLRQLDDHWLPPVVSVGSTRQSARAAVRSSND